MITAPFGSAPDTVIIDASPITPRKWTCQELFLPHYSKALGTCATNENAIMSEAFMTVGTDNSVLVYDVGGSHVAAAVCPANAYRLGPVVSAVHPEQQASGAFVDLLYSLGVEASSGFGGVLGAALAMPGPFDFAAGVSLMRHKLPYLYGVDLRERLSGRFGWEPGRVCFLHDSAAFLLGEIGAGSARGVARAVGITLGTGIGSAFAVNGRVVTEGHGVPPGGEIWNLPYEGGIIEDCVSSRAIRSTYERRTGLAREVAELATAAAVDALAFEAFEEFGHHLGQALRRALNAFAPSAIVLGGGISRSAHLFLPSARDELKGLNLELRVSELLDTAPLVGAGVAWFNGCNGSSPRAVAVGPDTHAD
jgi:glucokinase